ncbi:hypothetical protein CO051_07460 [Candidatus Roizmanbacteria bacterium CG_4_9_14_0_2_um_filter_39_13]|uniref:Zeta toxin domain-containing protein n=2 Tax=Candidatus Roizmaniibacteriota TaxID=1752723 RepID=A0A2M8EW56_9BACT|nr:MAG: hypothetical protein COY15_01790 [Candidatus Roizmanbacteria bacterium CG_4_10_14_0_2_um_filter_39_12]PJC30106.1 MAG: hypothetical protein CO051_07460 [Candidatus Roizmanbacteria bacterium CG_4_9_14_0_2_um_filter_39_13]PJE61549.1 MAG: hypothetical protein COU87_04110 [Candidatus Roizmanbacteria bacterium CG10_big_fil_rev_8_21_14_0_10_39_12]
MAILISADEIKKDLRGYSPWKAEKFHHESAQKADKLFEKTIKESTLIHVALLNGGTASGKTEFLSTQLLDKDWIIFDTTMSSSLGAKNKLRMIWKAKKRPTIFSVIPDDLRRAFVAFLNRERQFSDIHFYKTHSQSREALLWVVKNYQEVPINIVESSYDKQQNMQFAFIAFQNKTTLISFFESIQKTEDDILREVQF